VKRLLIRAPNWLGDAVMALPSMAALRAGFPHATISIAAIPSIAPLFAEQTSAAPDEVLTIGEPRREPAVLAGGRFDVAVLLPNSFRSAWVARRAGIPERWGFAGNLRSALLTRAVERPRTRVHQSEWYLELVRRLGVDAPAGVPRVTVTARTRERASALLEEHGARRGVRLIGLAPGAAYGYAKRWPATRVAELIKRLHEEHGTICVLVGAGGDQAAGREIESLLPPTLRIINLIGRTDLRMLAGVLAACKVFVSNDSGGMHLAAAVGVPVIAIFGPTDERVTAPLGDHDILQHHVFCRPCMLRECPIDHRCMKRIGVDRVYAAVKARLEGAR
jgi:heptosyltransferase-2